MFFVLSAQFGAVQYGIFCIKGDFFAKLQDGDYEGAEQLVSAEYEKLQNSAKTGDMSSNLDRLKKLSEYGEYVVAAKNKAISPDYEKYDGMSSSDLLAERDKLSGDFKLPGGVTPKDRLALANSKMGIADYDNLKRGAELMYIDERLPHQQMLEFDLGAGKAENDEIQRDFEEYKKLALQVTNLETEYARVGVENPREQAEADLPDAVSGMNAILQKYGVTNNKELAALNSEKQQYYTLAERAQYAHNLTETAKNAPDFTEKSKYVSTAVPAGQKEFTANGMGYGDLTHEFINGDDRTRSQIVSYRSSWTNGEDTESPYETRGYNFMTDEEISIYNYYYNTEGKAKAEEYLDSLEETLQARKGRKIADNAKGDALAPYVIAAQAGFDQAGRGLANIFIDEYQPPSALQVAGGLVREDLADNGAKLPDWLGGSSLGQVGYDVINTTSNMLPSVLASAAVNAVAPGAGAVVGAGLMGASAGGNAKVEMLNLGYSKKQANLYGALVGAAEGGMDYLLGGISKLGGKLPGGITEAILTKVDNALARAAIKLGSGMVSEGFEEGLQTVIEPWLKEIATNVDWESPTVDEVLYSSLLGALSSVGMNVPDIAVETGSAMREKSNAIKAEGSKFASDPESLINEALTLDPNNKYAQRLKAKLESGKPISEAELGRLSIKDRKTISKSLSEQDATDAENEAAAKEDAAQELQEKIENKIAGKIERTGNEALISSLAKTVTKAALGENVSNSELRRLSQNAAGIAALNNEFDLGNNKLKVGASVSQIRQAIASRQSAQTKLSSDNVLATYAAHFNMDESAERSLMVNYATDRKNAQNSENLTPEGYAAVYGVVYAAGKRGTDITEISEDAAKVLSKTAMAQAYLAGRNAAKISQADLQNSENSDTIIKNAQEVQDEQGVYLRDSGERNRGQNTQGQIPGMEGYARPNQSRREGRTGPRDSEAASLSYDREVDAKELGISGGLKSGKVYLYAKDSETASMKEAKRIAAERGLNVKFFGGGNLKIKSGDKIVNARAYIQGNDVYIRADHSEFTADQLMRHEAGHDMIDKGEVNVEDVRRLINERFTPEEIDAISKAYAIAYAKTGLTSDQIWEEVICDSLGDMNIFEGQGYEAAAEMAADFLPDLKEATLESKKESRGPPKSKEGKASRESEAKGADYLIYNFSGKVNVDYSEVYVSNDELSVISSAVKSGFGSLNSQKIYGRVYTSEAYYIFSFEADGSITIHNSFDLETDGKIIEYIEESIKNGETRTREIQTVDRWIDFVRNGQRRNAIYSGNAIQQAGENRDSNGMDGGSSESETGRYIESGVTNNQAKIKSVVPVKHTFTDISGRSRNVLGIGGGMYMVQGTQKNNYKFSSAEDAIAAENENIIQRYARKNNRTVTWVKQQLEDNPNFLKGKASQDIEFFDFLNENAEVAEATEDSEISERTNREILANALESIVTSEDDKKRLRQYKRRVKALDAMEAELSDVNAKIRELSFAPGARDKVTLNELKRQKAELEKTIQTKDKALIMLEASAPLQKVLERTKKQAVDKAKAEAREALTKQKERAREELNKQAKRYQESRAKSVEGRRKTEMRHKIQRVVAELDKLLRHGNKKNNVKIGLQDAVVAALEAFDINAEKVERYNKDMARLDAKIATATDSLEIEALTALREKKQRNSERLADKLQAMKKAYEDIHNGRDGENYPGYYKAEAEVIENRIAEVIEKIGNTPIGEMSLDQLNAVYDMYRMVLTTVQNANKVFRDGKLADLTSDATDMTSELQKIKKLPGERLKASENVRGFVWNELTPYYAFKRVGSGTLMSYYDELVRGQDVYARDVDEAKQFALDTRKKHGYGKWKLDEVHSFRDKDGRKFDLTLKHMMSIYAYSKREQALDHMENGGFFFNNKETFRKKAGVLEFIASNESGYKVDASVFAKIKSSLTAEQIAYVDEMQSYLTKMGEKGNEVTRVMWGIDIFKEKVYFPLKSKEDFIYQANTPAETSSLKNDGMTKETKPHASNPIVLEAFDEVWANHVEKMSKYHGFVIPIDNLNKLINYGTWMEGNAQANTVDLSADTELSALVEGVYGSAKYKKIAQYILDVLGKKEISLSDGRLAIVDNSDALHIANRAAPRKTAKIAKINEIIQKAQIYAQDLNVSHNKFDSFYYYETTVKFGEEIFPVYLNVGKAKNDGKYHIYDITNKIRDTADRINGLERPKPNEGYALKNGISTKSIPQNSENVNSKFSTNAEMGSHSISTMLEARFGSGANDYLTTFIKDLNGAKAQSGGFIGGVSNLFTKFKKTAVGASLSVVVQQPTAIIRATSEIDAKYFAHLPKAKSLTKEKKWDQIKKYAPIAIIKDIGGFDAGSGRTIAEWLNADTKRGVKKALDGVDNFSMWGASFADKIGWGAIWTAVGREVQAKQHLKYGTEEFWQACGKRFTEVIVKTQVYDSTLSRSGFMRGKDSVMKMATSFMGEPTLSVNMIADSILQAKRGKIKKRQVIRTVAAVYTATVAASIIKSFIYALRDDDEDESLAEKYMQALGGTILNDINPLSMLPITRDVISVLEGWDVGRSDMEIVQDLYNAIMALDSEEKTTWRKIEDLAGAMGALAGVPAKNFLRTAREVYNLVNDMFDGIEGGDLGGAFVEGVTGKDKSKSQTLYEALIDGDPERVYAIKNDYKTADDYAAAVRKALRDYDPRIREAAEAYLEGNIDRRNEILDEIVDEGNFDKETIGRAIEAEAENLKPKEEGGGDKEWSLYSPSDIGVAFDYCSDELALEIIAEITELKIAEKLDGERKKAEDKGEEFAKTRLELRQRRV